MRLHWVVPLFILMAGCGTPARTVRLHTGKSEPIVLTPSLKQPSVKLDTGEFERAMARLVLDVPLSVHPGREGHRIMRASVWSKLDTALQLQLKSDYGRWCERNEAPGDCLSLLEDGLHLDENARLRMALAFAIDPVWDGVAEAVRETLNPTVLKAMVLSALATYVVLLAFPEPVITKSAALVLTACLVAYLGMGPFLTLVQDCIRLKTESDRATTFAELEAVGGRFGRSLGANGTRILILLTTAALGSRAGMPSRGPPLPGYVQAAAAAEAQAGFRLAAVTEIQAIAINERGLVIGLAPTAVTMAAQGLGGGQKGTVSPGVRIPAPNTPKAFPKLERVKPKTAVQGGGALRKRWKDKDGNVYEWDSQHGRLEKYDKRGRHQGEFDPDTGKQTKPADPSRVIEP